MIEFANDPSIEFEYFSKVLNQWCSCESNPTFVCTVKYRKKPTPHIHQALIDEAKADPNIEWEGRLRDSASKWLDCRNNPMWLPKHEYRKKPKTVEMWQWAYKTIRTGAIDNTSYYETEFQASSSLPDGFKLLCKIEGSKIPVEVSQ